MQQPFEATITAADLALTAGVTDRIQRDLQFTILRLVTRDGRVPLTRAQIARLKHAVAYSRPAAVIRLLKTYPWISSLIDSDTSIGVVERSPRGDVKARSSAAILVTTESSGPPSQGNGVPDPRDESDVLMALVQSEIGLLFIDQTRFTPSGFAMGERVYSMSLAPGEEVTLEQKTYTQKETSLEELSEKEDSVERELSSTVSTEVTNSFTRQLTDSATQGLTVGGNLGVSYVVSVTASAQSTDSVTAADQRTSTNSVKETQAITEKVTSKMRNLHKTTFRVSTVDRFETTAKRVVRNPNSFSAIDLIYFKILQRVDVRRERTGTRLCWAPAIHAPDRLIEAEIELVRRAILDEALRSLSLPPKPAEPILSGAPAPVIGSIIDYELTDWDRFNGSMRADYDLTIPLPGAGYEWDGDIDFVRDSVTYTYTGWGSRTHEPGVNLIGTPHPDNDGNVALKIHAGADWGTAGAHLYVSVQARFRASGSTLTADDQKKRDQYEKDLAAWQQTVDGLKAAATANAMKQFESWSSARRGNIDVRVELLRALVRSWFPVDQRDEFEELIIWQDLFDWEYASVRLFPGWWSGTAPADPSQADMSFVNASWGQLFLPIAVGRELDALRWIYSRGLLTPSAPDIETVFASTVQDLEDYRTATFGDALERPQVTPPTTAGGCPQIAPRSACLGTWAEYLPTDGTHVEIIQSGSHAADGFERQRLADDASERTKKLAALDTANELRTAAKDGLGAITGSVNVNVDVDTDDETTTPR